ncbi:MFS transporter [Allosalinactinospora lopnorensis]|uniref:MFS transporter n=1 Tax=Allosalinactinospora lopnorensis TaxID=1352348 RepID=UPI0009E1BC7C|nr:MFS transporter [Allosalinactinospora lopnorensis]
MPRRSTQPPPAAARTGPADEGLRIGRVLPGLMLTMLLGALDQTIMAPALPAVAGDLGGLDRMSAVITAYLVAATAVMPLYGKLGDRFGRRPVLQAAIGVFVAGAALCALAPSMPWLIAARAVQGAGGGGLMIGAQAILGEIVSPRERGRYLGLLGSAFIVAAIAGPLVGGLLVDLLTWRWIFVLHAPFGALALLTVTRTLRRLPSPPQRAPIDYAGALCLATAVTGPVLLLSTAGQHRPGWLVTTAAAVTLGAGAGWLLTARHAADPIIPLHLFRDRAFTIPAAVSFLIGFAMFGAVSYMPAFLQIALGTTATRAGVLVTALMGGAILTMTLSGRRISRTGSYRAYPIAGTAVAALGLALLAALGPTSTLAAAAAAMLLIGLGLGLVMQVMTLVAQNSAAHADLGAATSTVTFLRQIGASAGVAVVGTLITLRFTDRLPADLADRAGGVGSLSPEAVASLPSGAQEAVAVAFGQAVPPVFGYVTPLLALAFLLTLALPARPLRTTAHLAATPEGTDTRSAP